MANFDFGQVNQNIFFTFFIMSKKYIFELNVETEEGKFYKSFKNREPVFIENINLIEFIKRIKTWKNREAINILKIIFPEFENLITR